jgi:phosphonatase-like hydrolase
MSAPADSSAPGAAAGGSISLVVFDMAGTTVDDSVNGVPLVTHVLQQTFSSEPYRISVTPEEINPLRGRKKQEMVRRLVELKWSEIQKAQPADTQDSASTTLFYTFECLLAHATASMRNEMAGTSDVFTWLHRSGVRLAVGSGFSEKIVRAIVEQLGWNGKEKEYKLAFIGAAEQSGKGRPDPTMIRSAMAQLAITDPRRVVKVGDTTVDVGEGKNAGCITVAVLSGTQTREELEKAQPDFILQSIADLPTIWKEIEEKSRT